MFSVDGKMTCPDIKQPYTHNQCLQHTAMTSLYDTCVYASRIKNHLKHYTVIRHKNRLIWKSVLIISIDKGKFILFYYFMQITKLMQQ